MQYEDSIYLQFDCDPLRAIDLLQLFNTHVIEVDTTPTAKTPVFQKE